MSVANGLLLAPDTFKGIDEVNPNSTPISATTKNQISMSEANGLLPAPDTLKGIDEVNPNSTPLSATSINKKA